ncbi:MAG: SRPBCC family protein [Pseudomonadota bacterium]
MPTVLHNRIFIARTPAQVYAYVTRPWLWHEWHPNSRSATADREILQVDDRFDETIAVQPLSPLPLTLLRATRYRVLTAEPGVCWEVHGEMRDGWLRIRYDFVAENGGTRFERTLTYAASGASRLLMPLLRPRMARNSVIALENLRKRLEKSP